PQGSIVIEGEHRRIDLGHHRAQQGGSLERAQPLAPQGIGQGIGLEVHQTEGVFCLSPSSAEGVISLTKSGQDVGESLQRPDHPLMQRGQPYQKSEGNKQRGGPLDLLREVAPPEQEQGNAHRRGDGEEGDEQNSSRMTGQSDRSAFRVPRSACLSPWAGGAGHAITLTRNSERGTRNPTDHTSPTSDTSHSGSPQAH